MDLSWQERSACADLDTELFFPVAIKSGTYDRVQVQMAKNVCASCPVRSECLTFALTTRQDAGIWGGTTENERKGIRRHMKRAS